MLFLVGSLGVVLHAPYDPGWLCCLSFGWSPRLWLLYPQGLCGVCDGTRCGVDSCSRTNGALRWGHVGQALPTLLRNCYGGSFTDHTDHAIRGGALTPN